MKTTSVLRGRLTSLATLAAVCFATASPPCHGQIQYAPPNDLFQHRTDLGSAETVTGSQAVFRASQEFGDPVPDSVWWQWTAPRDGWFEVESQAILEPFHYGYRPVMHVFQGSSLANLVVAQDGSGGDAQETQTYRLFYAKSGQAYQIAFAASINYPSLTNAPDIAFTLRPAELRTNTTLATRADLVETQPGQWTARGWATAPHAAPVMIQNTPVYQPLYWQWTCPATGLYGNPGTPVEHGNYPFMQTFRGTAITDTATFTAWPIDATAGEVFTFVVGQTYQYTDHPVYHTFTLALVPHLPYWESNTVPYQIGSLPRTVTPPTNAPLSEQLWWNLGADRHGWVEFSGAGLTPVLEGIAGIPATSALEILKQGGNYYFWTTPGIYQMGVSGWRWSGATQTGSFTLRHAQLTPPANDLFANALNIPPDSATPIQGSFLGATRSLGDPAGTSAKPSLWYRLETTTSPRQAELITDRYSWQTVSELGVHPLAGQDQLYFTEQAGEWLPGNEFMPGRFSFPLTYQNTHYLCLAEARANIELRLRTFSNYYGGGAVNLGAGPLAEATGYRFPNLDSYVYTTFRWQAPADGWITFRNTEPPLSVSRGMQELVRQSVAEWSGAEPMAVKAQEFFWFTGKPSTSPSTSPLPPDQTIRLAFLAKPAVPLGDESTAPVDLPSQRAVQTYSQLGTMTASALDKTYVRPELRDVVQHVQWFRWTAPPTIHGMVLSGSSVWWDVFADQPGGPLIAATDSSYPHLALPVPVESGRTYYLMLQADAERITDSYTPVLLHSFASLPADNDDFLNAAFVPVAVPNSSGVRGSGTAAVKTILTTEPYEPLADPAKPDIKYSAWWRWTAPAARAFTVTCLGQGPVDSGSVDSNGDFAAAVYLETTALAELQRVPGVPAEQRPTLYPTLPPGSRFTFKAVAGQTYLIQTAADREYGGISFSIKAGDLYDDWSLSIPGLAPEQAGPFSNPSGDGMTNLMKFCLGLNPTLPLANDPLAALRAPRVTFSSENGTLQYEFWSDRFNNIPSFPTTGTSSPGRASTAYVIAERSFDLKNWTRVTDATALGDNRWRATLPANSLLERRYIRLRALWTYHY